MADKCKTYIVTKLILQPGGKYGREDKEFQATSEDAARRAALALGWSPIKVKEKKVKKAA